ncbi:hypothetical protein PIB30_106551, partial [Stylosanthes scabra]|nr:hypothetical protein [Stylosanthes scabra]
MKDTQLSVPLTSIRSYLQRNSAFPDRSRGGTSHLTLDNSRIRDEEEQEEGQENVGGDWSEVTTAAVWWSRRQWSLM